MGHIKQITSLANPIVKAIKGLQQKKNRDNENLFLAEGLKLVTDAFDNGWQMSTLVYSTAITDQPHLQKIAVEARAQGTNLLEVSDKVLRTITKRDNPQMVVGVFRQQWMELKDVKTGSGNLWIGLDRVRDPGNLGTIIRTADCVGAKGVMLIGDTTDPWSMEAVRATMGSIFNVALTRCTNSEFAAWRQSWNGLVVGTHLEGAIDYRDIDYENKSVLALMGNEQQGLPPELIDLCTHKVIIPMNGKADSLNLAIATAVTAFEIKRSALKLSGDKNI